MGQEFYFHITDTMISMVPNLSLETIRRHFHYANFGLATTWSSFLSKDPIFKKWGINVRVGHELVSGISEIDLYQLIPYRTFDLERINFGRLGWEIRKKNYNFEEYELYLSELASGKLTIFEIAERAYLKYGQRIPKDKIIEDIVTFYNGLAQEFLITFRRFA